MPSMPLMSPAAPCGGTIARSAPFDAISALGWAAASAWSPSFQDDPDGRAKAFELERAADTLPAEPRRLLPVREDFSAARPDELWLSAGIIACPLLLAAATSAAEATAGLNSRASAVKHMAGLLCIA
jgi:hypothetical protein